MGLLDSLNPISMVSDAAESLCDALLPKDLEFVGDLVGLGLDFDSGNWTRCFSDVQDLFKDLPQQLAHLGTNGNFSGGGLAMPTFLEPIPPLPYGAAGPAAPTAGVVSGFTPTYPPLPSSWLAPPGGAPSVQGAAPAALTADGFFALSDVDLMNAVRNGRLPDAVKNDPQQMRRLDARINDITQMNQLITNMLKALHDMNAQIIQNIRV